MQYADANLSIDERHDANFYFLGAMLAHLDHSKNGMVTGQAMCKLLKATVDYQIKQRSS